MRNNDPRAALVVFVNGVERQDGTVVLDATDPGWTLGMGIFETLRTYDGRLFALDAHLERLCASAMAMGMADPPLAAIAEDLHAACARAKEDISVRVTITAGGTRVVVGRSLPDVPQPFRCATRMFVPPVWLDGTVKHVSRAYSRTAVTDAGVDEVLWTDTEGCLLEGTRSNLFAVRDGVLLTPPLDGRILAGVTREALIDAADDAGIPVELRPLHQDEPFDELYASSTLKELTGIDELDGVEAPGSGPVGQAVTAAFRSALG